MKNQKVLHITTGLKVGGAETVLKCLIEFDIANRDDIVVVSLTSLGVIGKILRAQGVIVHALNMSSSPLGFFTALWQLRNLIRQYQPEIVQTWMYHADLLGGLSAYLAGYKNIVWGIHHTSLSFSGSFKTVFIMKVCAVLSRWIPKKIICVADAARQAHIASGYEATRMVVIPNGFNFSQLSATQVQSATLRLACHFSESDIVIGSVGRFHADKGQDNFVKATAIVAQHYPAVKFLLVGRDCDVNNAQLMKWLNEKGLQARFVMLGERSDVPVCLAAMDVFCMPSRTEGFPIGLGEAMATGLPCVATNVGDTAVLTGDTAILVPPQNAQALAQGLLEVIAMSAKQREQMGQRAKERVMSEFSIEKTHVRFEAVYQEVMLGSKT